MTAPVEDGKEAMHVVRSGSFHLPVAPVRAFPSFSPEGERAWAPGWAPEYLYPADGAPRPGLVFRTAATGERTLWMLLRYDVHALEAQYVRIVPESRIALVTVRCAGAGPEATEVVVAYEVTALSAAGNLTLQEFTAGAFAAMLEQWQKAIVKTLVSDAA